MYSPRKTQHVPWKIVVGTTYFPFERGHVGFLGGLLPWEICLFWTLGRFCGKNNVKFTLYIRMISFNKDTQVITNCNPACKPTAMIVVDAVFFNECFDADFTTISLRFAKDCHESTPRWCRHPVSFRKLCPKNVPKGFTNHLHYHRSFELDNSVPESYLEELFYVENFTSLVRQLHSLMGYITRDLKPPRFFRQALHHRPPSGKPTTIPATAF